MKQNKNLRLLFMSIVCRYYPVLDVWRQGLSTSIGFRSTHSFQNYHSLRLSGRTWWLLSLLLSWVTYSFLQRQIEKDASQAIPLLDKGRDSIPDIWTGLKFWSWSAYVTVYICLGCRVLPIYICYYDNKALKVYRYIDGVWNFEFQIADWSIWSIVDSPGMKPHLYITTRLVAEHNLSVKKGNAHQAVLRLIHKTFVAMTDRSLFLTSYTLYTLDPIFRSLWWSNRRTIDGLH